MESGDQTLYPLLRSLNLARLDPASLCGWGDAHVTTATAPTAAESKHHMSKGVARRYATVHAKASLSLIPHKSDFRSEVAWREDDVDPCDTCYPVYPAGFVHFEA